AQLPDRPPTQAPPATNDGPAPRDWQLVAVVATHMLAAAARAALAFTVQQPVVGQPVPLAAHEVSKTISNLQGVALLGISHAWRHANGLVIVVHGRSHMPGIIGFTGSQSQQIMPLADT